MTQWNPTIALKTANEMLEIDRKENAIQVLNECLSGKKNKNQWQPILEEVISLLLDTCLKSQNYKAVKDGLHQYRTICFPTNSASLDKVIHEFLIKADNLVRETKESLGPKNANNTDEESIESKILRSVTGDNYEDRNERTQLQPYIKFMWESFRAILDLIRNRTKLELAYFKTATKAMRFCVAYERKQEFKRIGEMLRSHFQQLITHTGDNAAVITVNSVQASPNSLHSLYGARFEYLNCSIQLELWQEAFRTVEDINEIMKEIKRQPSPQRMAVYFEKLAQLFWTSHNYVFHAYAWLRFYLLSRDQNKNLSELDLQRLASIVLVSALSVPVEVSTSDQSRNHQDFFELHLEREKNSRLSALLGKSSALHREQLLNEIRLHDIPSKAVPELRDLYHLAEVKFHPMELCNSLSPIFKFVEDTPKLARYSVLLKKACFTLQLQQLSRVFQTMKIDRIYQLAPVSCPHQVEKLIVKCVNSGLISARINHRQQTLTFLNTTLESSNIKTTLFSVHEKLHSAVKLIQPEVQETTNRAKQEFFAIVPDRADEEYRENRERFETIEGEKEKSEKMEKLKARLAEAKLQLENLNAPRSEANNNQPKEDVEQTAEEKEKAKALTQAEEKRIAFEKKLQRLTIKNDYLERARREEEAPLLQKAFEQSSQRDRKLYEEQTKALLEKKSQEHQKDLEQKQRFAKMKDQATRLKNDLLAGKKEAYERKMAEVKQHNESILKQLAAEKEKIREQKIQEERARKERIEKKRLAEQQRRQEDEARRQREEEERAQASTNTWKPKGEESSTGKWARAGGAVEESSTSKWSRAGGAVEESSTGKWARAGGAGESKTDKPWKASGSNRPSASRSDKGSWRSQNAGTSSRNEPSYGRREEGSRGESSFGRTDSAYKSRDEASKRSEGWSSSRSTTNKESGSWRKGPPRPR